MSNVMDRKVVEMQFDNSQFERNVKGSITTLDKLKESLKFEGVSKSIDEIDRSTGKLDFSGMRGAIETVTYKFSVLESIALGALMRIGERATDAGIRLAKSMSVDNISAGWSKFEEKTKSVGTLIAQGYDMSLVNEQLEKLNFFTDETSYSFTNMVSEIAKFTATGKGLEDSVTAMMGIANWAAMSGQNASTASRAMFQLSQAMGSGVMRKEDYKSIQNVSMDTKEFRQRALDAGEALKTLKKNADGTYQSIVKGAKSSKFNISQFADHLTQDAWFTSDVMMKVYSEYAYAVDKVRNYMIENGIDTASEAMRQLEEINRTETDMTKKAMMDFGLKALRAAQEARSWGDTVESVKEAVASGFSKTFEIIFGQYDEAVDLWTDLAERFYDMFATPINNFNKVLETALKGNTPYIKQYFATIAEGNGLIVDGAVSAAKNFGYSSEQTLEYVKNLAHGNDEIAKLVLNFVKLNKMAGEGDEVLGASTEKLISYTAEMMGVSEEQVESLKKIGDEFGYNSGKYSKELAKIFGAGKNGAYETVTGLLAVGKGLDVIESKDLDRYLTDTLKFTSDQVTELHKLAKEYGANSDQVDNYIKSLQNFKNFGYGNRGWTRTAIKGLLEITDELSNTELGHKTGDIVDYVSKMTGADEDSVKILYDLVKERRELTSATKIDTEAVEKNAEEIDEWANSITNGNEALKQEVLELMRVNDEMGQLSGYRNLLPAFNNVWEYLAKILGIVSDAFHSVFGSLDSGEIYKFTERLRKATENLKLSDEQAEKLRRTFKGFFSIFKILGQIAKTILIPIKSFFGAILGGSGAILDSTAYIGDWLSKIASSGVAAEKATEIFTRIGRALEPVGKALRNLFDFDNIKKSFTNAGGGLKGVFAVISSGLKVVTDGIFEFIGYITGWDVDEIREKVGKFFDTVSEKIINILPSSEDLSESITKIGNGFKKLLRYLGIKVGDDVSDDVEGMSESFDTASIFLDKFNEKFKTFKDGFSGFGEKISGITDKLKGFGGTLSEKFEGVKFLDILNEFGDLGKIGVLGLAAFGFIRLTRIIRDFSKGFKWLAGTPSDIAEGFKFGKIGTMIKNMAIAVTLIATSLYIISKIDEDRLDDAFWIMSFIIGEIVGVMELINHTMSGKGAVPILFLFGMASVLRTLAKSMTKLANEIDPDQLGNVTLAMTALVTLIDSMALVVGIVNKMNYGEDMIKSAIMVVILAAAVSLISGAMIDMARNADSAGLTRAKWAVVIVAGVLIAMSSVAGILSHYVGASHLVGTAGVVVMLAFAISMIIGALTSVSNAAGDGYLGSIIAIMGLVVGALYVMSRAVLAMTSLKSVSSKDILLASSSFIIMSLAISIIIKSLGHILEYVKKPSDIGTVAAILGIIVGAIATLLVISSMFSKYPAPSIQGSASIVALAIGIAIIARALTSFKDIDPSSIIGAGLAMSLILTTMGIVLKSLENVDPKKIIALGATLLAISVSVWIFSKGMLVFIDVLHGFSSFTKEEFWPAIGYFVAAAAALGLAGALIGPAAIVFLVLGTAMVTVAGAAILFGIGIMSISAGLIALASAVLLLGGAWKVAGEPFLDGLTAMAERFLSLIPRLARALVMFAVEMADAIIDTLPRIRKQLYTLLTTGIGLLCDSLLASVPKIAETVFTLLITVLDYLLDKGPEIIDKVLNFVIMVLDGISNHIEEIVTEVMEIVVGVLNGIANRLPELIDAAFKLVKALVEGLIDALANFEIDNIEDLLAAAVHLLELTGILGAIALAAPVAIAGIIALGTMATTLLAVLAALGGISKIPGLMELIDSGGGLLSKIGEALGDFLGGFVGGVLEGISNSLPTIGSNLSSFADNASSFISVIKDVGPEVVDGATNMALALMIMSGAALIDAVTAFMGADIGWATLGVHVKEIGTMMAGFAEATADVDAVKFNKVTEAAKGLSGMLAVFGVTAFLDTVLTFLGADIGWSTLKQKLVLIGQAMTSFSEETGTIDVDKFVKVTDAASKLSDMVTTISSGESAFTWLVDKFLGKNDMGDFGKALGALASGLSEFSEKTTGISGKTKDIDAAIDVAGKALNFSKKLSGGDNPSLIDTIIGWLGTKNLDSFGKALASFASGLVDYAKASEEVSKYAEYIEIAYPYYEKAIALSKLLNDGDGLIDAIAGLLETGNLALFGPALESFASGIVSFGVACIAVVALGHFIDSADPYIRKVIKLSKYLNDGDNIVDAIVGLLETGNLALFGPALATFAGGLIEYAETCKEIVKNESYLNTGNRISNAVINFAKKLNNGSSIIDKIANWTSLATFGFSLAAYGESLKAYSNSLYGVNFEQIKRANELFSSFSSFASITSSSVLDKQYRKAEEAAERSSKSFGSGFVDGVSSYVTTAEEAASKASNDAIEGIHKSISDSFAGPGPIEHLLTIKPVLDLSEIQNGSGKIGGMLDGLNGYSISGSMGISRAAFDSMTDRTGDSEEVNSIEKLTEVVKGLGDKLDKPVEQNNSFNFYGPTNDEIVREVKKTLSKDIIKEGRRWA